MTRWLLAGVVVLTAANASPAADAPAAATRPARELVLDLGDKVTMKLALIPAGDFIMGSPWAEKHHEDDEEPQRRVKITKPFYMGITEVTQEQYMEVMENNPSNFSGKNLPLEKVSWDDAVAFCKKLSQKTGKTVRLPTEAEWEYACRAGSATRFSFGDDDKELDQYAWYNANSDSKTHPVGQKKPNAWGLYDMHGNVWEWCSDWYQDSYRNLGVNDPTGPEKGSLRVLRGSSWLSSPWRCRSALRRWIHPDLRIDNNGFRVAVVSAGVDLP